MTDQHHIEEFDHTADIGFRIVSPSLAALLIRAAQFMFNIICPKCRINARLRKDIIVEADDYEQLLVNWLSELNYYFQTEQFLFAAIEKIQVQDYQLRATILGERIDPERHAIRIEIKAVTFHKIYVHQVPAGWAAQVIFDI